MHLRTRRWRERAPGGGSVEEDVENALLYDAARVCGLWLQTE